MSRHVSKRQALADADHEAGISRPRVVEGDAPTHSALATKCFHMWSQGLLSTAAMQELSLLAILDGAQNVELAELASIGTCGANPGNAKRDFMARFCGDNFLASPTVVESVFRDPKISTAVTEQMAFFRPDLLIQSMANHPEFDSFFGVREIRRFWDLVEASGCPKLIGHPITFVENWKDLTVPLWVHGDGVEFQDRDSLMVWTTGSLLSLQPALDSSLLIAATAKSCTLDESSTCPGTWKEPWRHLQHAFLNLANGTIAALDPDGKAEPLAENIIAAVSAGAHYRFIIWCIEGDHEFFSSTLKLPHWGSHRVCWNCNTDVTDAEKTWRRLADPKWNLLTPAQHRAKIPSHPLLACFGVSTLMIANDSLHVLFNKGILSHFLGSLLHLWCYDGRGVRQAVSPANRLALVFDKIQEFWRRTETACSVRLTNLKLSMFCNEREAHAHFPALNTKGGETKHLLPAMCWVMELMHDGSELHQHVTTALVAINKFVIVMDEADWVPSARQSQRLLRYAERFLKEYEWLESWAKDSDRSLFHAFPKFRMFHRLA